MPSFCLGIIVLLLSSTVAVSQPISGPLDLLLPAELAAGYRTRAWVREQMPDASDTLGDLDRLDMIWLRALEESDGDIGRALFASLIATFKHRSIPFSFGLSVPITVEDGADFALRTSRLPRHLYIDAPTADDRDKLQHFFASAWLAWRFDSPELPDLIGLGIEVGEDAFVRGGANDPRDVRTNRLGHLYVQLLRTYPRALPGEMFRAWSRQWSVVGGQ